MENQVFSQEAQFAHGPIRHFRGAIQECLLEVEEMTLLLNTRRLVNSGSQKIVLLADRIALGNEMCLPRKERFPSKPEKNRASMITT